MRVRLLEELLATMSAGKDANIPADAGVVAGLQVENRIANSGNAVDTRNAGGFQAAKDEIRCGAALRHFIAANNRVNNPIIPAKRGEQQVRNLAIESRVEGNLDAAAAQPMKSLSRSRDRAHAVGEFGSQMADKR